MTNARPLQVADVADLPTYPISASDRLDSHYFLQWNLKRWRASEFRRKADPEVGWFGFQLFCIAQDETPIGTLPCDDFQLAYELRLPLERWQALINRELGPLHGWHRVRCDNGEIRWAHKVVTEVAEKALESSRLNAQKTETRKINKRLADLRSKVEAIGAAQLLKSPAFVDRFDAWLEEHHAGVQRREPLIRAALDQFMLEQS